MFSPKTKGKSKKHRDWFYIYLNIVCIVLIILMFGILADVIHYQFYTAKQKRLTFLEQIVIDSLTPVNLTEYTFASIIPIHPANELIESIEPKNLEGEELYKKYARDICRDYELITGEKLHESLTPEVVISQMYFESRFDPSASNSSSGAMGLLQIVPRWHKDRMAKLSITDLLDPHSNILVGVDLMNDLLTNYCSGDIGYALMLYNMNWNSAKKLYSEGKLNTYAKDVLAMTEELAKEES